MCNFILIVMAIFLEPFFNASVDGEVKLNTKENQPFNSAWSYMPQAVKWVIQLIWVGT